MKEKDNEKDKSAEITPFERAALEILLAELHTPEEMNAIPFRYHRCRACTHFHDETESEGITCDAFPEGIPREIWYNHVRHRKEYPGDKGIRFERREGPYNVFK